MKLEVCAWCEIKFRSEGQKICKQCKKKMFEKGKRKVDKKRED